MKIILLVLTLMASHAMASEETFIKMCSNRAELPEEQRITMQALIKIGSGVFSGEQKTCSEVAEVLRKLKHLAIRGGTFEYLEARDLTPIATLDWIESLNLDNQKRVTDLSPLSGLNLRHLDIQGTGVKDLTQLKQLSSIRTLGVTLESFMDLHHLSELEHINDLELNAYSFHLLDLTNLRALPNLGSIHIKVMGNTAISSLDQLKKLVSIKISGGKVDARELIHLPLKNLVLLESRGSTISYIDHLAFINALETLILGPQGLKEIHFLKGLVKLKKLDLSGNEIGDISQLAELKDLEELNLSSNSITYTNIISNLEKLKILNLSENKIHFLKLDKLSELENLNVRNNGLHKVEFDLHPKLKILNLASNQLRSHLILTLENARLPQIERLDLANNKITDLSIIGTLTSLKVLRLDDNKIMSIDNLQGLMNLEFLSLRYNLLRSEDQVCPVSLPNRQVCDFLHQEI